ncbi:serine/threonine-protein kinase [Myceligenerans crystallogenes]|uniref:Protein kinase domain-containing protein n=1 Tax=Myceligenerans crystallogenes TaxID=316335 RepID=A0ABN2N7N4_9MICO
MPTATSPEEPASSITVLRPEDPRHLGPYRLLGVLGSGGMGTVYLGRTPDGENVAVKVVRLDLTGEQEFRERFAREVDAARRVHGSHTAGLVYADPHARQPWMATVFVLGPSLREAIHEGGPLDIHTLRALGLGLAEGLMTIHAAGLVHRDLKPGNVLLTEGGPRIIDFGIARALEATALTSVSQVLGTASYMSPEQVRGFEAGTPSDVFSLGCVLAYASTGNAPFGTGQAESVAYRVVHTEPDLEGVPAELMVLVSDCLAKDPARRPTPQEIVERITRRTQRPVTWRATPAINTMIAVRAKQVRGLEAQADAEPTEPIAPLRDDLVGPGPVRPRRGATKLVAAALAGVVLPIGGWMLYERLANPSLTTIAPDGWYSMEGEPLPNPPASGHWIEIEITTPSPGQRVLVGYAASVIRDDGGPAGGASDAADRGGESRPSRKGLVDTQQVGNEEGFLVSTPWRGRIPVDASVLTVGATATGEGQISCAISVDDETVVTSTDSSQTSCLTPFDGEDALSQNIRSAGATPVPPATVPGSGRLPTEPTSGIVTGDPQETGSPGESAGGASGSGDPGDSPSTMPGADATGSSRVATGDTDDDTGDDTSGPTAGADPATGTGADPGTGGTSPAEPSAAATGDNTGGASSGRQNENGSDSGSNSGRGGRTPAP